MLPALLALFGGIFVAGSLSILVSAGPIDGLVAERVAGRSFFASIISRMKLGLGRLGQIRQLAILRESTALGAKLAEAGTALTAEEFAGLKAASAACAIVVVFLGEAGLLVAPIVSVAAFRLPDFLLGRSLRRRERRLDAEIPQLLDVLAAGTAAGLSAQLALQRSVPALRGPLADELASLLDAVALGGRWRVELAALSNKMNIPDLRRAANAITRTEMLGVSLADTLRDLAADVRAARRATATERARKAPVKMLFPLVFMILPAFLLLTVVPVLLSTLRSIG